MSTTPFASWLEVATFAFKTKQGRRFVLICILLSAAFISACVFLMRPDKIEIVTKAGTLSIKRGDKQDAIFLLMPGGNRNDPWVGTGVFVKSKDKLKISASGRVHTSLKRLVHAAETDEKLETPWTGPEGVQRVDDNSVAADRNKYKVLQDANGAYYGYGMLLASVRDSSRQLQRIIPIGNEGEIESWADGELVLTVNDVWLSTATREAYVQPFENNEIYYQRKAQETYRDPTGQQPWSSLKSEDHLKFAKAQFDKRSSDWSQKIIASGNWNVWYNDNIGGFAVSITVN